MIKRWKLDAAGTPAVKDGPAAYAPGRTGQSLAFDGKEFADAGDAGRFGYDDRFSFAVWVKPKNRTGAILSRMADEAQGEGYAVELIDGKIRVALTKRWLDDALRVETAAIVKADRWQHIAVSYDGKRLAAGVKVFVDGVEQQTKVLLDELNQDFQSSEPLRLGTAGDASRCFHGQLEEVRVYGRVLEPGEVAALAVPASLAEIVARPAAKRSQAERDKLRACFLERIRPAGHPQAVPRTPHLARRAPSMWDAVSTVMVMEELPTPRDAFVLIRGQYDKHGEKVSPGVPAALSPMPKDVPNNRLGLAKWLVDPANPLTARVAVNRMWQLYFGRGLVRTAEDFGTQGEYPTHPELLDWLATEFIRSGWDIKKMHRLIVTSSTYRQSSRITRQLHERDPDNKLLARGPRLRLSAEMIRDQALYASGLLVEKRGGPSVKPYQPAGLWNELSGTGDYKQDHGEKLYRRSLYTYWKRTIPPPTLGVFDTSPRETCWVRETRTNTPLHALTLLNDITFVEAARVLAERVMKEETTPETRIAKAFHYLTARGPTQAEAKVLLTAFERQLASYKKHPGAAKKFLRVGEAKADPALNPAELAAYANVCSLIMNLDEALTKE